MTKRRPTGSWWQLALIVGPISGLLWSGIMLLVTDESPPPGGVLGFVVTALLFGVPFGLFMGWWGARANRRALQETQIADVAGLRAAARVVGRRSVPADPQARTDARRLALHRLEHQRRQLVFSRVVFGLAAVGYLIGAIFSSPWWLLGTLLFGGFFAASFVQPARLQRRIAELEDDAPSSSPSSSP